MYSDGPKNAQAGPQAGESTTVLTETVKPRHLPMYRVILHNDDANDVEHVIESIVMLTPLNAQDAAEKTVEAHKTGCSLLLVIHKERAELYAEQFHSRSLTVTIEPSE